MSHTAVASVPTRTGSDSPLFERIAELVREAMTGPAPDFVPGVTRIPLNVPTYGPEEILEALDSMMSGWVTMGKKVQQFEKMWASYVGASYGVMTNSGSSANLLALTAFDFPKGSEIITPALTWATTVFPIAQAGYVPVLVDVDLETYNIDPDAIEAAITPNTKAIMLVHLLGNPCDMNRILDMASAVKHKLIVIEDACESHGAEYHGGKTGSFGQVATFSFFFSHHISTIEGGMIVGQGKQVPWLEDKLRSLRAFGWVRDCSYREKIAPYYPAIDPRFLFEYPGYNFRPTEVQGAFGIHQLPRLEGFIEQRRENAAYWNQELAKYGEWLGLPQERPGTRHVYFAYPIRVKPTAPFSKDELVHHLESKGLETRPIEAGNMAAQPAMHHIKYRAGPLLNAEYLHHNAFFFGNHQGIGLEEREAIASYFHEFLRGYVRG